MKRSLTLALGIMSLLWLVGCASRGGTAATEGAAVEDLASAGAQASALGSSGGFAGTARSQAGPKGEPGSPLSQRVIYFDFDQSSVATQYLPVVQAHAEYLRDNPRVRIALEGHTDERGTREYNIALGDRRANAVSQLMIYQGVAGNQVERVSYGEEQPAAQGSDESAWAQNRRVEIVYGGGG